MIVSQLKKLDVAVLNGLVVSAYKAMGFMVLTALLLGLGSFIGLNAFFFVNRTWVAPMVISPSDERVLVVTAQLAQQSTLREKLNAEQAELQARLAQADRSLLSSQAFDQDFRAVAAAELGAHVAELRRVQALRGEFSRQRKAISRSNRDFSQVARNRADQLLAARLLDSDTYASIGHQLSQVSRDEIGLAQSQVQLDTQITVLMRDIEALETVVRAVGPNPQEPRVALLSYDILKMKEDYTRAVEQLAKARADRDVTAQALAVNASSMARYDKLIATIRESPYLRAVDSNVFVAFVPYDNLDGVHDGAPLYGCHLGVVFCKRIGEVAEVMQGEVYGQHPTSRHQERGLMIRMTLAQPSWAKERVLFVGRAPLFI